MAESDSQATVVYSYSRPTASSRRGSDKTYCASNKSDRDTSGYSDISDSELSQACDVVLGQTDGFADRYVLHFSGFSFFLLPCSLSSDVQTKADVYDKDVCFPICCLFVSLHGSLDVCALLSSCRVCDSEFTVSPVTPRCLSPSTV